MKPNPHKSLILVAGAVITLGALSACSTAPTQAPIASQSNSAAVAMPRTADFIADLPAQNGDTMTMAVAVSGDHVAAYATHGSNSDAWFFGTQHDGTMTLTSMYGDDLTASYDGGQLTGELTMNEADVVPQRFTAKSVTAPAGMYTADLGNSRASWIVRPDHTMVGVMDNSAPGDHKVTDAIANNNQQFKDRVRQMRLDRQMQQAPSMTFGTWTAVMHGTSTTATRVTGDMTF